VLARRPLHLDSFLFFSPSLAAQPEPFDFVGDTLMILFFVVTSCTFGHRPLHVEGRSYDALPRSSTFGQFGQPSIAHHLQRTDNVPFPVTHEIHTT
jgi:hypothetical protein